MVARRGQGNLLRNNFFDGCGFAATIKKETSQ
jgi:hypothetical protein